MSTPRATHHTLGLLVMVASSVVFAALGLLVRLSKDAPGLNTYNTTFFRFLIGSVFVVLYWTGRRRAARICNWRWLFVRGLFGGVSVWLYFYALTTVGLAKGTILSYTYPVWAGVFAPFLIGEKVGARLALSVLAAFGGLYLIVVPASGYGIVTVPDFLALVGGLTAGIAVLAIKKSRDTEESGTIFLSQCLFGLLIVGAPTFRSSFDFGWTGWAILLSIGLVAAVGQMMMTFAYKHVGGTEGSLLSMLTPVGNVLFGVFLFREVLTTRSLLGGAVVLAACVFAAIPAKRPILSPDA